MCGIFGLVLGREASAERASLERAVASLFRLSESRGKEASGLAVQDAGRIGVLKLPVSASRFLASREYAAFLDRAWNGPGPTIRGPLAIVGHTRLVTNGERSSHADNQPVVKAGVVCAHNGIVVNVEDLWREESALVREYEVDTEVIAAMIARSIEAGEGIEAATARALERVRGTASIAALFDGEDGVVLATNNGSLYYRSAPEAGLAAFASERSILTRFAAGNGLASRLGGGAELHLEPGRGCRLDLESAGATPFALATAGGSRGAGAGRRREIWQAGPTGGFASPTRPARAPFRERDLEERRRRIDALRRCKRCVMPETMPFIDFDEAGVCKFCRSYLTLPKKGAAALEAYAASIRRAGGGIDCIVPLSGGRDSCYVLHHVKRVLGLSPVAYTYDWGMVTDLARRNQARLCGALGVEHIVVSADIPTKRRWIRQNVSAWLARPVLGLIPLFMAGDKQFFYHAHQLKKETGARAVLFGMNDLENEDFKVGFCGIDTWKKGERFFDLTPWQKARLALFYGTRFLSNPRYLNASLLDTAFAYFCYYLMPHDYYVNFYSYVPWDEDEIVGTLRREYDWELATDTTTSWRIGDGTAAFYNYIYYVVAGFTEIDAFRSNQIREGRLTRDEALALVREENRPRYASIREYCDLIGLDVEAALDAIDAIPTRY